MVVIWLLIDCLCVVKIECEVYVGWWLFELLVELEFDVFLFEVVVELVGDLLMVLLWVLECLLFEECVVFFM